MKAMDGMTAMTTGNAIATTIEEEFEHQQCNFGIEKKVASPLLVLGMMTLVSRLWCVLASERLAGAIAFFLKLRCVRALEPPEGEKKKGKRK